MQPRIKNPAVLLPDALPSLLALHSLSRERSVADYCGPGASAYQPSERLQCVCRYRVAPIEEGR